MKNINIRVEDSLKTKVEELAEERGISVTELVTENLTNGLDPSVIPLRLPETTVAQLREAAQSENMKLDKYVEGVLRIHLQEPWSVWKSTPSSVDKRTKVMGWEVFEDGRKLVREMWQRRQVKGSCLEICATVPRALHFGSKVDLPGYRSWHQLYRVILSTLDDCQAMSLRRVVIYSRDRGTRGMEPELRELHRRHKKANFEMREVDAEALMRPGESDRSYLNDFNVYGDLGVVFTEETSFGLPLKTILSRDERDIEDWKSRFEEVWELAKPVGPDSGEVKAD